MSGNLTRRVADLELAVERASGDPPGRSQASRKLWAVLDELARLKASGATYQRAGKTVEGEDIPRQVLGPDYTLGQLVELAAERAADSGAFGRDEVPGIVAAVGELAELGNPAGDARGDARGGGR